MIIDGLCTYIPYSTGEACSLSGIVSGIDCNVTLG